MAGYKAVVKENIPTAPLTNSKFKIGDYIQVLTEEVDLNGKPTRGVVVRQDSDSVWVLINFDDGRKYWLSEKCLDFVDEFKKKKSFK